MDAKPFDMNTALQAVMKGATLAQPLVRGDDGRLHALVPKDFDLKDITDKHALHPRPKAVVTVDDRHSLVAYSKLHQTEKSLMFADYTAGTITTQIDWHPHNQHEDHGFSGAREHAVRLTLQPSEEFARWNAMEGKMHAQADFAQFIEENANDIHTPEPGIMLELSRDLEAVSGQSFKARTRLENGDVAFQFETESKIVSKVQAPTEFKLNIPVYHGEAPELLVCKFRWRPQPSGLLLGFVWHRVEYMRRARFTQIATQAAEDTGLPVIMGRAVN